MVRCSDEIVLECKIGFIDGRMIGFTLGTSDGIKLGINESNYMVSFIGSYKISKDKMLLVHLMWYHWYKKMDLHWALQIYM